jgi:hypothetical protein
MGDSSLRYAVLSAASDLLHRVMNAEGDRRRRELAGEAAAQSEIHVDSRYVGHRHHLHTSAYVSIRQHRVANSHARQLQSLKSTLMRHVGHRYHGSET